MSNYTYLEIEHNKCTPIEGEQVIFIDRLGGKIKLQIGIVHTSAIGFWFIKIPNGCTRRPALKDVIFTDRNISELSFDFPIVSTPGFGEKTVHINLERL